MESENRTILREMDDRIHRIERLALELKDIGEDVPMVEKNARTILSAVFNLRFGISDLVEIDTI